MKIRKKVFVLYLIIIVLFIAGIFFYFFLYRKKVEVVAVSEINRESTEGDATLIGTIFDPEIQKIRPEEGKRIDKIMVKEGEHVEPGTPLLQYDVKETEFAVKKSEVKIQQIKNRIERTDYEIKKLQQSEDEDKKERIEEQEKQKAAYNLELKKEQRQYEKNNEEIKKGTMYSKNNGIVTHVKNLSEQNQNEDPVMEISGENGIKVKVEIPEYLLGKVKEEDELIIDLVDSSDSYKAKVVSIDAYPSNLVDQISYYRLIAQIEENDNLKEGSEVQVHVQQEQGKGIWVEKAYIREENGKKYVLKEDKRGRLKKTYIKTGRSHFDMSQEVVKGLKDTDYIAFPYGNGVKEGARTKKNAREGN